MSVSNPRAPKPLVRLALLPFAIACAGSPRGARTPSAAVEPIVYTIRIPAPSSKTFDVDAIVPTDGRDSIPLMMPIWSPGMYTLQSYGDRVTAISAHDAKGTPLAVDRRSRSRWMITTRGQPTVEVTYTLSAPRGSNLSSGVTDTSLVVIGPATFMTRADNLRHPAEVRLELPAGWHPAETSLDAAPGGKPNDFVAPNYDVLVDSPILAGSHMSTADFTVAGVRHRWVYLGDAQWSAPRVVTWLTPLIEEHARFWGTLPYTHYSFLNIVGGGPGSGVEHLNSVAINTNGREPMTPAEQFRYAAFLSHEYFHAMNVKRLRPVELGPFDYENTPVTTGLWVGEGLTSYFGDLLAARSGLGTPELYLALVSKHITDLQNSPGRLLQTIEQASSQMFERLPAAKKVDYYVKGPVVGIVLDAHIRTATNGKRSMDDVIRTEYQRWSGAHGYTEQQFDQTVSDAAGVNVEPLLHKLIATTDEVDYSEMLDWFGWRFVPNADPRKAWTLEVRPDATPEQRAHFADLLRPSTPPAQAATGEQTSGYITVSDGAKLYYRTSGRPGPGVDTIIAIHGGPGLDLGTIYNDMAEMFGDRHFVIYYDQRGGGRSDLPADTTRLFAPRQIQDLDDIRQQFGIDKATLVAHSYGPLLAGSYAIAHPDHVRRMIFFGPVPPLKKDFNRRYGANFNARLDSTQRRAMRDANRQQLDSTNSDSVARAGCREYWRIGMRPRLAEPDRTWPLMKADFCETDLRGIRYGSRYGTRVITNSFGDWDLRPALASLHVPLLVVHGEEETIPMDLVEAWVTSMPKGEATLLKVPRAAHFTYLERPDIVWPAVEAFLKSR